MGKEQELLEAARTGNVALVEKLLSGKKGILGSGSGSIPLPNLLSMWKGLNVNCTDSTGYTPLHHASLNGHRDVVLKLLQFEASTSLADSKGCFPLHLAAWRGDVDIVRILLQHGSSHCRVNQQVNAAIEHIHHGDFPDPHLQGNHERETALHCAAQYGHSEVVSVLLQELTDPTMRNSQQETPLDLAALYGRLQVVRMLVSAHPNLMTSHTRRHTPLHLAARNGHRSAVQTLLEAGMDVNCVTENGSALHEAALCGKTDVVRLLLDSGGSINTSGKLVFSFVCRRRAVPARPSPSASSSSLLFLHIQCSVGGAQEEPHPRGVCGLLHGSSPACETPDTPYHLYSPKPRKHACTDAQSGLVPSPDVSLVIAGGAPQIFSGSDPSPRRAADPAQKPQVVYRTIFHTRVNQEQARPADSSSSSCCASGQNGGVPEYRGVQTGGGAPKGGAGCEERACTLGRMRSIPRSVLDLQRSKSLSKSDSNLVAVSPILVDFLKSMAGSFDSHFARHNMMWQCQLSQPDCRCYRVDGYSLLKRLPLHPLIGPRCPMQSVGQWLDSIGLVQYENHLLANGFDNVQFMGSNVVEDQDLLEIGILNSAHRQRLLQAIRLLPRVRPVGYDGNNPTSVAEWLESLELGDYTKSFLVNGYTSMELVKKIWEIELVNVLKISLIGHRKRILASLGDRLLEETPQKPPRRVVSLRPGPVSRALTSYWLWFQGGDWCEPITLRPPNEATSSTPVQYWQHHPEKLIFQSCDYEAYYLGSMLVKELRGTESTQDACAKMRKSTEQMKKVPTIVLSVSYKGVKFIDATNKNIIAEHEIRNISCAAQDPEDLSTFAYITKDLKSSHHYCHVFTAFDVNLAYEIILTLGQAFEVAYQLALQARKSGHGSSTLPESFDSKPSKPVPKPRVNIRKSVMSPVSHWSLGHIYTPHRPPLHPPPPRLFHLPHKPSMDQKGHANVPWIVEPGQEAKRGVNTKYETTIF
uniref:Ankyrin repeat and sterile alpha motif domain containing 1B n=1 Tax=Gasterosteus aculeatus aculeatus TaxID=481459 RepID=G3Q8K4_GASAC